MNYKRIPVMIDAATGRQIDENGRAVNSDAEFMRLMYAETCVVCATFYNLQFNNGAITMTPHSLPGNALFTCMGDSDFDSSNSLMFFAAQSSENDNAVDIPGDWLNGANANRALGQVSFRVNTNTERFIEVLSANRYEYSNAFFAVEMIPAGETASSAMASFRFKAVNRVASTAGMPVSTYPEYLNKTQIEALLADLPAYEDSGHADNTDIHITSAERNAWNAKANAADIPSDLSDLTDTSGLLTSGGSSGGGADWFLTWTAANFPQDWNEVIWTNIGTNRPAPDYDSFKFPVFAVDYAVAEGMGAFVIDAIPAGAANLIVKIPTAPSDGAATGDNMGWKMDVVVNEGAISTVTLGSTALSSITDEFVTGSYTVALSGITAAAGDMITCLIYPDTAVDIPKQCDWRVKYIRFEVS